MNSLKKVLLLILIVIIGFFLLASNSLAQSVVLKFKSGYDFKTILFKCSSAKDCYYKGIYYGENGQFDKAALEFFGCSYAYGHRLCLESNKIVEKAEEGKIRKEAVTIFFEGLDYTEHGHFKEASDYHKKAIYLDRNFCEICKIFEDTYGSLAVFGAASRETADFYVNAQKCLRIDCSRINKSKVNYDKTIHNAQKKLKQLGYDPGPLDGLWGERTRRSIEVFQRDNDLSVTGELDKKTIEKLELRK